MPRKAVVIPTETVEAILAGVTAGASLSKMCRERGVARSTAADYFSAPSLAGRLGEARASGRDVRASRPRRRAAASRPLSEAVQRDLAVPAARTPSAPLPPAGASLQADPPRRRHAAAPGAAVQPAPTAPAADASPSCISPCRSTSAKWRNNLICSLHLVADATARGAPRP